MAYGDTRLRRASVAFLVLGIATALPAHGRAAAAESVSGAGAGTILVTKQAALNGRFGLEIRVAGQAGATPGDAFVAVGPEKGFSNETALEAGFTVDVSRLSLSPGHKDAGKLSFLHLGGKTGPARVVVFLEESPSGAWFVGARTWDDASGTLVLAGRAPLPPAAARGSESVPLRLELEWTAFSPDAGATTGYLRMQHVQPDGSRVLLFERTGLDNGAQAVDFVRIGVADADRTPGVSGRLFLDDVEVSRLVPSLP